MRTVDAIVFCFAGIVLSTPVIRSDNNGSPTLFQDFQFYAQHVAAVYCNTDKPAGQRISCANDGCTSLERNQVEIVAGFTGALTGIGAYVSIDNVRKEIVLAVRGTTNFRNALTDINLFAACNDIADGSRAHAGFLSAWNEISRPARDALTTAKNKHADYKVVIAGHSLGAGVATVGAAYLRRDICAGSDLFTYGSPRVGNDVFADFVTGQAGTEYRITHYNDATPDVPFLFMGYRHAGNEYWLSTPGDRKVDYTPADVKICTGSANLSCSGSVLPSLALVPHRYILTDLYACGGLGWLS